MSDVTIARIFIALLLVLALLAVANPSVFAVDPPPVAEPADVRVIE